MDKEERFPAWLNPYDSELFVKCRTCGAWNNISAYVGDPRVYRPSLENPYEYKCVECGSTIKVDRVYFFRKNMKEKLESEV